MDQSTALVLLAKWPGGGRCKTRLASKLRPLCAGDDQVQSVVERFVRSSTLDLVERLSAAGDYRCVLLYAPPIDEARDYFADLLAEAWPGQESAPRWQLLPVLSKSDAASSNLGAILADAALRARAACGCGRVAFMGADCPELPLRSIRAASDAAAEPRVAAICPAADGGYTLLVLPEGADEQLCFAGVNWSAPDTCVSQLAALTRAGLRCAVLDTYADVDELEDLQALTGRLLGSSPTEDGAVCSAVCGVARGPCKENHEQSDDAPCPRTRRLLAELLQELPALRTVPLI